MSARVMAIAILTLSACEIVEPLDTETIVVSLEEDALFYEESVLVEALVSAAQSELPLASSELALLRSVAQEWVADCTFIATTVSPLAAREECAEFAVALRPS